MMMPGRTYSAQNGYRYGFNGKEMDNEVNGTGAQYDYGFRIYDTRIGKFLSMDPLTQSYPWYTPYQFAGNKPINSIDLDGLEEYEVYYTEFTNHYGQKVVMEDRVKLTAEQQRPEFGTKGTLYHISIQNPNGYDWRNYEAFTFTKPQSNGGVVNWFRGLFGSPKKIVTFQLVIFGSGHEDPKFGPPIDYTKPFSTFDFNEFMEIYGIVNVGKTSDPKIDAASFPKMFKKWGDAYGEDVLYNSETEEWRKNKEKQYEDPGEGKAPNLEYDITPDTYPMPSSDNLRRTIIRTDEKGMTKDTIRHPNSEDIRRGKKNPDTIPNKKYIPPITGKKI